MNDLLDAVWDVVVVVILGAAEFVAFFINAVISFL
jgi:hypothetical protein|tara:strand:+ start:618 stop:722 length:105 start_codon:yes stop_codon:yes gene_type:complete